MVRETLAGIDSSFDLLTLTEATKLKQAGIDVFVQCLWTGIIQPQNRIVSLRNAVRAGMTICGYISLSRGTTGAQHMTRGRAGVPDDIWNKMELVFVDVELPGVPVAAVRTAVNWLVSHGKRRAIYTSFNAWTSYMNNALSFTDCLLWNASWDNDPDVDFERLPFGGWMLHNVVGEQYSGGEWVEGQWADRNVFFADLLLPQAPVVVEVVPISQAEEALMTELKQLRYAIALYQIRIASLEKGICEVAKLVEGRCD